MFLCFGTLFFSFIITLFSLFQTDLAIVERQTQHSISEKSIIQHKAAQLELKLEGAIQERKRLEDMHEFQSQQQDTNFERVKVNIWGLVSYVIEISFK